MNQILGEVWRIKDELAREAGDDLDQFRENTRQWAAAHPHSAPALDSAGELQRHLIAQEAEFPVLREEPPPYGVEPP